ncbi:hypothetical protein HanOQP8_Chr01g0007361 [Helianthus annuus]|nr:hypothetical protein HanOQP8_Chr01g0007361 [Helianthus annuus]
MVWRVLYTLEHIIEQEGIDIGMSELSQLYNLVCHGSYQYLFKSKPQKPPPILKTTKNDTKWRNQFFFVSRDSIPKGNQLPKKWNTDAINLSHIQKSPVTEERVEAFWKLDPIIRTFPPKSKDLEEISSTSYTMSSACKSSKSALRFSLNDLQDIASPKSLKKDQAVSQSNPKSKGMSTSDKGTKRKKLAETSKGLPLMERQPHDYVSERLAEISAQKERTEIMDGAKLSASITMLKIKLQMAKEAEDPSLDRSAWDLEAWKQRLVELGYEDESEEVPALEGGGSEVKDPTKEVAGGSGKGGEENVDDAAKV